MPVLNVLVSDVAECPDGPLFDHVTVSPTWMVTDEGLNLKSEIVTVVLLAV